MQGFNDNDHKCFVVLLMVQKSGSPVEVASLSHYLRGLVYPRWCRTSSINSSFCSKDSFLLLNLMSFREKQTHAPHLRTQKQKTKTRGNVVGVPVNVLVQMKDQYGNNRQGNPEQLVVVFFFPVDVDFNEHDMGVEPKIGVPENGWFIVENPIKNG